MIRSAPQSLCTHSTLPIPTYAQLPFYLATIGVDDVPLWAGIILSGQFAAVVLGESAATLLPPAQSDVVPATTIAAVIARHCLAQLTYPPPEDQRPRQIITMTNAALSRLHYHDQLPGNLVWGVAADRFGARKVLQITMVGDAIFFAATGFCRNLPLLIVVRVFAGLSTPLVPSLAYIFEKCTKEGVVAGMAR
jgi:MFS family permease